MREKAAQREKELSEAEPAWRWRRARGAPSASAGTAVRRSRTAAVRMLAAGPADAPTAARADVPTDGASAPLRERAAARTEALLAEAAEALFTAGDEGGATAAASGALRAAAAALEAGLIEREGEARLLLLALVGGEHLLLLGPPGTAKSELCRRLSTLAQLSYFERTLTRFSTPEELFGPLSLSALERDEFKRASRGYAPDAELVFVDEIFKANSAILNTLLTLLNERLFDEGAERVRVPLLSAVAASNEGPESDELAALYDRFLLRKLVSPVSDDGVLRLLLGDEDAHEHGRHEDSQEAQRAREAACTLRGTLESVRELAPSVTLPRWVALLLRDARTYVVELGADGLGGGYVSDRRLRRSAELLKSSAAAHGRRRVSVVDALAVLPHVLWEEPDDAAALDEWVETHALPEGGAEQLGFLLSSLEARAAEVVAEASAEDESSSPGPAGSASTMRSLEEDATALALAAVEAAAEMRAHATDLEGAREHLFLPPTQAASVVQRLGLEARRREGDLAELATRAVTIDMAIREGLRAPSGDVEQLMGILGGEGDGDDEVEGWDDGGDDEAERRAASDFSEDELQWGRKEAKSRLSVEEYKAWRRAAKKRKS